ncbi:MAG: sulfatase [Armatimonadetes bacterium]|nr:sulfatase [Armatimonadota bacterium]
MSDGHATRREFLAGIGAACAVLPLVGVEGASAPSKQPNLVFILTDDHRFDAMSCMGHPFLRTPNIDRIAREGAIFRNAFVTTSLCSPSRASFLTGRYAHSHGVLNNATVFEDSQPTFPTVLKAAGYETAFVGKWHMAGQEGPRKGFDYWFSFKGQGVYYSPTVNDNGEVKRVGTYMTDLLTDKAVEWLNRPRNAPFCLYLSHKAVHGPFQPAVRHKKLYAGEKIERPKSMSDTLEGKPEWIRRGMEPGHDLTGALTDPAKLDELILDYCRTLVAVDEGVGRVLDTLEAMGELDNTVIVFCGDNGYFLGEHGRVDKRLMYEESIRIPMVMRYPKVVKPGTEVQGMVLNIDLCPTFLDLAGVTAPQGIQGRSFRPLLRGKARGWREEWMYEYFREKGYNWTPTTVGVRTERWKYIEYLDEEGVPAELYDLREDPTELRNLVDDAKHADRLSEMRARLARLRDETGYPAGS